MTQLYSRENTPSCMADEETLVLARIIMDLLVIWSTFTEIPEVSKKCHRNVPGACTAWSKGEEVHLPTWPSRATSIDGRKLKLELENPQQQQPKFASIRN